MMENEKKTDTKWDIIQRKIYSLVELKRQVASWRLKNDKIVFTNGCFDILHQGHATYLAEAASLGNRMIVAVNADASVKKLKGENRPVNNEHSRALLIASLHVVDAVIIFHEDTPLELIKEIQPDVLTKGGDYEPGETDPKNPKYIVGSDMVKQNGGKIISIPFVDGFSTTGIMQKINS